MSKLKQETQQALEAVVAVQDPDNTPERQAMWDRDSALSHALALHKINGGMKNVGQIIADAQVIQAFLKGEFK